MPDRQARLARLKSPTSGESISSGPQAGVSTAGARPVLAEPRCRHPHVGRAPPGPATASAAARARAARMRRPSSRSANTTATPSSRQQLAKQDGLGREVPVHGAVVVEVVLGDVGQPRHPEPAAGHPPLIERDGGDLHGHVGGARRPASPPASVCSCRAPGRGQRRRHRLARVAVGHRADHPRPPAGRRQDRLQQVGGGGLAVGAGDRRSGSGAPAAPKRRAAIRPRALRALGTSTQADARRRGGARAAAAPRPPRPPPRWPARRRRSCRPSALVPGHRHEQIARRDHPRIVAHPGDGPRRIAHQQAGAGHGGDQFGQRGHETRM